MSAIITRFGGDTSDFDRELAKVVNKTKDASRNIDQSMTQTAEKVGKVGSLLRFGSVLAASAGITTYLSSISNHAQDMVDAAEAAGNKIDDATLSVANFGKGVQALRTDFLDLGVTAVSVFTRIGEWYGEMVSKIYGIGGGQADPIGQRAGGLQGIRDALDAGNQGEAERLRDAQLAELAKMEAELAANQERGPGAAARRDRIRKDIELRRNALRLVFTAETEERKAILEAALKAEMEYEQRVFDARRERDRRSSILTETPEAKAARLRAEMAAANERIEAGGEDVGKAVDDYSRLQAELLRTEEQIANETKRRADEAERAADAARREAETKDKEAKREKERTAERLADVAEAAAKARTKAETERQEAIDAGPRVTPTFGVGGELTNFDALQTRDKERFSKTRRGATPMRDIRAEMAADGQAQRTRFDNMAAEFRSRFETGSDPRAFELKGKTTSDPAIQHLADIATAVKTLQNALKDS